MKEYAETLIEQFKDKELAHAHVDDFLNISIATQLKVLREQRGLTQTTLAQLADMMQARISVMEDINYSSWSISTLKKLARAFDVSLKVSFESFDTLISDTGNFNKESLQRDTRTDALRKLGRSISASDSLTRYRRDDLTISNKSETNMSRKIVKASEHEPVILKLAMKAGDSFTIPHAA